MSTDKFLAEVKARSAAATPGPWVLDEQCCEEYAYCDDDFGSAVLSTAGLVCALVAPAQAKRNLAFAAHARADVDRLVAGWELMLDWMRANVPEMECRGDEDCDHCEGLARLAELDRIAGGGG